MSPLTTQVSGSQWNARNAGAQSCTGSFALSGFVYNELEIRTSSARWCPPMAIRMRG